MQRLFTKSALSLLFLLALSFSILPAQTEPALICGVSAESHEAITERLIVNKTVLDEFPVQFRNVNYVPLKFHLVAEDDGSGRISFDEILDQLCDLNADFSPLNIQFYLKDGFDLIDNSTINNSHTAASFAMTSNNDPAAVNIWVVKDAKPSGVSGDGIIAGYYDPARGKDWVIMRTDKTGGGQPFLTHEVGHYFSLLHPHRGWDSEAYDPAIHGVPAPERSPGGIATELQDGSNCEIAGDRICDTAPDYNNGLGWNSCDYTPEVLDPSGKKINPDERLHMGYFFSCRTDRYFSKKQKELIQTDYMSNQRRHIRTGFTPAATEILADAILTEPAGGSTTAGFNSVLLEWTSVAGATHYFIEIDGLPTFQSSKRKEFLSDATNLELTNLEPGKRYFWRVRPFGPAATCTFASPFSSFTTGTATGTNDLLELKAFNLSPNPADRDQDLQIELETSRSFEAQVQLYSITGQLIQNKGVVRFTSGKNIYRLPLNGILPGVYLFTLQSEIGRVTERVVVH